jgi:eukaryotic-like serine/threonine-protein kinase
LLLRVSGTQAQWASAELNDDSMALARMHEGKGEFAEALNDFAQASEDNPKNPAPRVSSARLLARLGRFKESADNYRAAIDMNTSDHYAWYRGECTLAYNEDTEAYKAVRTSMLGKYASATAPEIAERTAKACLLLPGSADEIALASALADRALQAPPTHNYIPYFQLAKGMAECRSGRNNAAIDYLTKAANSLGAPLPKATAELWLALAQHQSGDPAKARQTYARAMSRLPDALAAADSHDQSVGGEDWLVCKVTLREASRTLEMSLPATQSAATPGAP